MFAASKCLTTFTVAATMRPRLSAFMSSEAGPQAMVRDLLLSTSQSTEDKHPPTAPADSYPRAPPVNPLTFRSISSDELQSIYHLHWKSTKHNTVATFTDADGHIIGWVTGGSCGFKHSRRGEYEAGYQCAVSMFKKIEETLEAKPFKLELIYKGFGQGRMALDSALMTSEGEKIRPLLQRLTDRTPLKFGGTRAKKARRL